MIDQSEQRSIHDQSFIEIFLESFAPIHLVHQEWWLEVIAFLGTRFVIIKFMFSIKRVTVILLAKLNIRGRLHLCLKTHVSCTNKGQESDTTGRNSELTSFGHWINIISIPICLHSSRNASYTLTQWSGVLNNDTIGSHRRTRNGKLGEQNFSFGIQIGWQHGTRTPPNCRYLHMSTGSQS